MLVIDPDRAAEAALELFDHDQSGDFSQMELQQCTALLASLPQIDSDKNGSLSAEELSSRFQFWVESPTRIAAVTCLVRYNGRALEGAMVKFVPEVFLGDGMMAGSGLTMNNGTAMVRVPDADLPPALQGIRGVQLGLYRVEITHAREQIPARYNTETTLSQEVAPSTPAGTIVFDLKGSKR